MGSTHLMGNNVNISQVSKVCSLVDVGQAIWEQTK